MRHGAYVLPQHTSGGHGTVATTVATTAAASAPPSASASSSARPSNCEILMNQYKSKSSKMIKDTIPFANTVHQQLPQKCPLLCFFSCILGHLFATPESLVDAKKYGKVHISLFTSEDIPDIDIREYFERILMFTGTQTESVVLAFWYLYRICDFKCLWEDQRAQTVNLSGASTPEGSQHKPTFQPFLRLTQYNIHRLLLISLLVASKYAQDQYFGNRFWAKVGGSKPHTHTHTHTHRFATHTHTPTHNPQLTHTHTRLNAHALVFCVVFGYVKLNCRQLTYLK
jgi:hypothetical protein